MTLKCRVAELEFANCKNSIKIDGLPQIEFDSSDYLPENIVPNHL